MIMRMLVCAGADPALKVKYTGRLPEDHCLTPVEQLREMRPDSAMRKLSAAEKAEVRDCYAVLETPRPVQRMHPRPTLW